MKTLRHTMILASAGAGKTYALTNRFVALLALGAEPERIVALTFTRKAAGEFFDEILRKLARAAAGDQAARDLARQIELPNLGPGDFLRLLRRMVDAMHRLRLGTLDSFFARVARTFPLELGLSGEFEILQEHAARLERRRVLRRLFARAGPQLATAQAEFVEAFKRATFGAEEKQLGARLDAFLDAHQENFLAAPDGTRWGDPTRIWPAGTPWLRTEGPLAEAVAGLRRSLPGLTDGQRGRWEAFFAAIELWSPGAGLEPPIEYMLKNALVVWRELGEGSAEIVVDRRKLALGPPACDALRRIITLLVGAEFRRRLEMTRGIFAVLRGYESIYHDTVRRAGRLTFADVQRVLAPVTLARGHAAAETAERRLLLDYRLDAEIDHWLLDEFQDTSFGQWSILRNLIDEVVQDPEGRRTFFCVGDVKQAIYAWREGDPRLFREIFDTYNAAAPGAIVETHLVESWRSGPPLIEMINAVFGRAGTLTELFPGEASTTWNREWRDHRSAVPERTGQAALLHAADEASRWDAARRLIREIRPLERGLTCAVLVPKNDTAAALADHLRRAGIAAMAESDLRIGTDNPLGAVLLALVQAAAHPNDTLAQEHIRMSPLGAVLARQDSGAPDATSRRVLRQIHEEGFERMCEYWIAHLEPSLAPDDAFSRLRGRQFAAAAGLFDAGGGRDPDEFIAFMERHAIRPPESAAVVRVMTIHKAKGLGFDVVIVPDLQGNRIDERRDGLAVQKARDRSVEWILDLPPKLFCTRDEVLAAHVKSAEAEACYENLSLLYVALTRAKRALYVVIEPVGNSTSRNFCRLLADALGDEGRPVRVGGETFTGAWTAGAPDWHTTIPAAAAAVTTAPRLRPWLGAQHQRRPRRVARRASGRTWVRPDAGPLFALEGRAASAFGTAVHERLATVEWATAADAAGWRVRWRREQVPEDVLAAAAGCIAAAALGHVWQRPMAAKSEVWRERAFEFVVGDDWITGVFDRVVVERGPDGRAVAATVFDFKTDAVHGGTELAAALGRYAEQLRIYRQVAAVLTGLPPEAVRAEIVFTQALRAVALADGNSPPAGV